MSEAGDYSPGIWRGHDFANARRDYASHAAVSYTKAKDKGVVLKDLIPVTIKTESMNPVGISVDQSGSMGDWPGTMRSKLPYLEHEAKTEYMGTDVEISWSAFGDVPNNEDYPLQVRPFTKGKDLDVEIMELVLEGEGGGTTQESSELVALYYARNAEMPNAIRSLFIFVSDESPYPFVDPDQAERIARVKLEKRLSTKQVFEELKRKFSVYFVQKPYSGERLSDGPLTGTTKRVHEDWAALVGEDHIALLADPGRVVDVIFGIMAREAGKIKYFKEEIEERQKPDQVKSVYAALRTVHALPTGRSRRALPDGRSVIRRAKKTEDEDES